MRDCQCGKPVRLGAIRVKVNRNSGVLNYVAHADMSPDCEYLKDGKWDCVALKPYAKRKEDKPYAQLIKRWDAANPHNHTP